MRAVTRSVRTFEVLFLESLREALNIMLDEKAAESFLAHLEEKNLIQRDGISKNQRALSEELEKVFGVGAAKIEDLTAALLFSKVGLKFEKKNFSLADSVMYAQLHGTIPVVLKTPITKFDPIDIKIIEALRKDGRRPVLQVSKEIGVSRPTVINRLARLVEGDILSIKAALNLNELNFKTSFVAFEVKNQEARQRLEKMLLACPRVLMLLRPTGKANVLILLWGEDQNTLNSTIESFRSVKDADLVYVYSSDPPLLNDSFSLKVFPVKGDIAPCGKVCADCLQFVEDRCMGCPAVNGYKGPL